MTKKVFAKLFGNKGYTSKAVAKLLFQDEVQLNSKVRKTIKKQNLSDLDTILLRKRALVELVNDEFRNVQGRAHTAQFVERLLIRLNRKA